LTNYIISNDNGYEEIFMKDATAVLDKKAESSQKEKPTKTNDTFVSFETESPPKTPIDPASLKNIEEATDMEPATEQPIKKTRKKRVVKAASKKIQTKDTPKVSLKLKKVRFDLGWSQLKMAQKLGISQGMLSLVESGKQTLGEKSLIKFKKILTTKKSK
jgi:DNA-binding XRE family transcriptional regulator